MVKIPPTTLPEGLTDAEYRKLSTLYMLMGRLDLASKATEKCTPIHYDNQEVKDMTVDEQFQLGSTAGQDFALRLLQIIEESTRGSSNTPEKLGAAVQSLRGMMPDALIDQLAETLPKSLESALKEPLPSRQVPAGLSAQEYFDLAKKYKSCGWTEPAREALQLCINLDGGGELSDSAMEYLRIELPRHPVPMVAEMENIRGYNLMDHDKDIPTAKKIFLDLTKRYPDFEWPFANLANIYLKAGDLEKAHETYLDAIKVNPYYTNAWIGLGRVNIFKSEFAQAKYCFNKASEFETKPSAAMFISMVETIESWDNETNGDAE